MEEYRFYKFPSAFKQVMGDTFLDTVEFNGRNYIVGDNATKGGNHLWDLESLIKYAPLFLKYLKEIKNENIKNVVLSIPTATFANSIKKLQKGESNYFERIADNIKKTLPEVEELNFLPQGVSAIYYYKEKKEINEGDRVLTLDGGFNTLNIAITEVQTPLNLLFQESVFDKGIRSLLIDKFLPLLQKDIMEEIPKEYHFLKKIFLRKEMEIALTNISVSPQVELAVSSYLDEVMDYVLHAIQRESDQYYNIINVVGGISYYLQDKINTSKKLIVPKKNGEFLTAIGMAAKYKNALAVDLGFGDVKVADRYL